MNKKQYLDALEKELRQHQVPDVEDVLADYQAHFARKAADGYTEEEIARKLGTPREIAEDFLPLSGAAVADGAPKSRALTRIALCILDLFAFPVFVTLFAWAIGMLAGSLAVLGLGVYLALGLDLIAAIPVLTVAGGILLGVAIVAAAVLLFMGALWFMMLAGQMTRSYLRWHVNRWSGRHELSLPVMPQITGKKRRVFRRVILIALIAFILLSVAGFIVLSVQAGTPGFWHHWRWFDPVEEVLQVL
ncbi:MAG TPA: DUF1700 domain-containing protein [Candidatus Limiplasma sp.]|nr:DUF1700 domain-containing protein [Candidatus Limiplasma sp.]HRX07907.1 DUF1700 domain-containing protein [Candidatus Limiplasma sp.]